MKKIFLAICLLMLGCQTSSEIKTDGAKILRNNVVYYKDIQTNICFATLYVGDRRLDASFTYVPCSPEVEKIAIIF